LVINSPPQKNTYPKPKKINHLQKQNKKIQLKNNFFNAFKNFAKILAKCQNIGTNTILIAISTIHK
jgi:hypothetical protein